jgi:hypothetical protein
MDALAGVTVQQAGLEDENLSFGMRCVVAAVLGNDQICHVQWTEPSR